MTVTDTLRLEARNTAALADQGEALADAAAQALVAFRAAEAEAAEAVDRARASRLDTLLALSEAGWSVRRIAAELDLSPARVGQLLQAARAARQAEWETVEITRPAHTARDIHAEYLLARHAWEMQAEAFAKATPGKAGMEREELARFRELVPAPTWGDWISRR